MKYLLTLLFTLIIGFAVAQTISDEIKTISSIENLTVNGLLCICCYMLWKQQDKTKEQTKEEIAKKEEEIKDLNTEIKTLNEKIYSIQSSNLNTISEFKYTINEMNRNLQDNARILEKIADKLS